MMGIINIKIVLIGHLRHNIDLCKLKKFKSRFFQITEIERINTIPNPQKNDGYCDVAFVKNDIKPLLKPVHSSGLVVGIINYRFQDNFYLHRIEENRVCLSIADIDEILLENKISIENFLLKNIYELCVFLTTLGSLESEEIHKFVHRDTRGCLFDFNGDKFDVLYNTEQPKICDECKSLINSKSVPDNYVKNLENELKKIRKPIVCNIELFIKKYPLFSVFLTFCFGVLINLISSIIWKWITSK